MKRIALISEHASPLDALGGVDSGGQNVYVAQVGRHLARSGYHVDVFTRRTRPELPLVVEVQPEFRVVNVPAGPPTFVRKEELLAHMPEFTRFVLKFFGSGSPYDLLHANFWMSGLVAAEIKALRGIPFVITFHALGRIRRIHQGEADGFPDERFAIEDRIMDEADGIIAECPQDRADQIRLYDADPSRIRMIPCGFDPDELWPVEQAAARETLGIPRTDRVVLHLGRMVPRKGVENVIRAFALYRRSSDVPSRLLIAGGESDAPDPRLTPEIGRLQQIAENEGVDGSVVFVGRRRRQELRYWYSAADVFVTTPWYEPFGITPLESMACGTPVIGSRVGGIQYSVLDGVTGYLVPPNDAQALAQRLETIFSDPALRRTLGRKAIERANAKFTWEGVTRQIGALYEGVLTGGRQRLMSASPSGSHVPSAASAGGSHG